jgi:hypothetical protein
MCDGFEGSEHCVEENPPYELRSVPLTLKALIRSFKRCLSVSSQPTFIPAA